LLPHSADELETMNDELSGGPQMRKLGLAVVVAAALACLPQVTEAAYMNGTVGLSGAMDVCNGGCSKTTLAGATLVTFMNEKVELSQTSGTFLTLGWVPDEPADVADFQFSAGLAGGDNTAKFVSPLDPNYIWSVTTGNVSFYLTSVTGVTVNGLGSAAEYLLVSGDGYAVATGYDNTPGFFAFSGQNSGQQANFTFSASTNVFFRETPEPATTLLFGVGLLVGARAVRRRVRR
jgi:hypothetical protein